MTIPLKLLKEGIIMKYIILIPAYEPDNKLIKLLKEIDKKYTTIIINDGSSKAYDNIFKEAKKYYGTSVEEWDYPYCTGISYESLKDFKMIAGRKFKKMDEDNRMPFCIIAPEVATKILGNYEDSKDFLGKSITINGLDFEIVGVYENENSFGGTPPIYVLNSYAKDYFSSNNS